MLQRKISRFFLAISLVIAGGCDQRAATMPTTRASDSIVSLSPAATDLLIAIGAGNRLVGVSTYDSDPSVANLPRVGDYENVDWERIATLGPKHMIVQMAADRVPAGFRDRAKTLGIELYVTQIDDLSDIPKQMRSIATAVGKPEAGAAAADRLQLAIGAVANRTRSLPKIRTLIVTNDDGTGVAGRGTYLNDLLEAAGGENAVTSNSYVTLDREALLALAPEAIIQLAPSPTVSQREAMKAMTTTLAETPAVKTHRVLVIEDAWSLMPGSHVSELAERFGEFLHPTK